MTVALYILVMAGVTYLVRMIPFTLVRKKIKSKFIGSVLYYMPYAVLSAMTFPAIFSSTGSTVTAAIGAAVAVLLSLFDLPLIVVALCSSAAALLSGFVF